MYSAYDKDANKIKIGVYHNEDEEFQSFMDSRRGTDQIKSKGKIFGWFRREAVISELKYIIRRFSPIVLFESR